MKRAERGNALFIILIAVALFAALSYAVSQFQRGGGTDASRETTMVNASQIIQYPVSLKSSIMRMMVINHIDSDQLLFDAPPFLGLNTAFLQGHGVFYPNNTSGGGGGAVYAKAIAGVMVSGVLGEWVFNGENQIKNIGTSSGTTTTSNADIIAFLPGVTLATCQAIHQKLGISMSIPSVTGIDYTSNMISANPTIRATGGIITASILDGQPLGCFENSGAYIYYHAIIER